MKTIANTFFKGLLAFLPAALTVYAVYAFGTWLNRLIWSLSYFVVATADYNLSRRLNFGKRKLGI